jgi:hypothetical protein
VVDGGFTHRALVASLRRFGDPLLPLRIASYTHVRVTLAADVKVADDANALVVLANVEHALRSQLGFSARHFGQSISLDEIASVAHAVSGVVAIRVSRLHRTGQPATLMTRIDAATPIASISAEPVPAELLTIDDAPMALGVMP